MQPATLTMKLQDKVAVITGAGQGFGEGMARLFAQNGAAVVIADLNLENATRVAEAIQSEGGKALPVEVDVSQNDSMQALTEAVQAEYNRLDIFVNNAGTSHNRQQGQGVFINIASTAGIRPRPGLTWYNGTKGAVITLTKSMAVELAPENIRVNGINPVAGETPLLEMFLPGEDTPEVRQKFRDTIPMGRLSQPLDIARAALFLASEDAEFITGVCLEVDGGRCV